MTAARKPPSEGNHHVRVQRTDGTSATTDAVAPANARLAALAAAGVSIWLDELSRDRLRTGQLARAIRDNNVVGVTTNPSICARAIAGSATYDAAVLAFAAQGQPVDVVVRDIVVADVQEACDTLSETWESTKGVDGRVSLEVDPALAHDADATVAQAVDLWKAVDRPNLLVKVPGTSAGVEALAQLISQGICVNVTLIFSVDRYRSVAGAYLDGLERAAAQGRDLSSIVSVASFFVSRVDAEVDARLEAAGDAGALALRRQAGVANARLAYDAFRTLFGSSRWHRLAARGAHVQRLLWASTGVKNSAYPDTFYVSELVVKDTVNTMPERTLLAFADHGEVRGDTVTGTFGTAGAVVRELQKVGIDLQEVAQKLEAEGIESFHISWQELLRVVQARLDAAAPAARVR